MSVHGVGGGIQACIACGIPACLAAGLWWGVVSQQALQVSRPTPRGTVEGSDWGGLQAHTQGGSLRVWPGGSAPRGVPAPWGCLPQKGGLLLRGVETPLMMATAVGGMHPTGMHSCKIYYCPHEVCEGCVFTHVCLSFCSWGHVWQGACIAGRHAWQVTCVAVCGRSVW